MKQSDISQQLGSLINQTSGIYNTVAADEEIPSELQEPDPLFVVKHDDIMSSSRSEALASIQYIAKSIIPVEYINDDMIQNKMKIDAVQLGNLYYQQKMTNIMLQAAMDQVAKGDTQPRMYEVVDKYLKRAQDMSQQITDLQNQFRKYYIDSYLDIESKRNMDMEDTKLLGSNVVHKQQGQLMQQEQVVENKNTMLVTDDGSVRVASSKQSVQELNKLKIQKAKKIKEAEFKEIVE